jgi:hypothetical protein
MPTRPSGIYSKAIFLTLSLCLMLFFPIDLKAQEFLIEHSDCLVRVKPHKEDSRLDQIFKEQLLKKKFKVSPFISNERVLTGEMYADYIVTKGPEKLYKKCSVEVTIHTASGNRPSQSDKPVFKKKNSRSVPRITFSGSERCSKALKEAFIHMPKCRAIGFAGEKK